MTAPSEGSGKAPRYFRARSHRSRDAFYSESAELVAPDIIGEVLEQREDLDAVFGHRGQILRIATYITIIFCNPWLHNVRAQFVCL